MKIFISLLFIFSLLSGDLSFAGEEGRLDNKIFKDGEWRFLTLEEWIKAVVKYNKTSEETIHSISYPRLYRRIPGAPHRVYRTYGPEFKKRDIWFKVHPGKGNKIFKDGEWRFLTLEEWMKEVVKYNETAESTEKIFNLESYEQFRLRIPGAVKQPEKHYGPEFKKQQAWHRAIGYYYDNQILEDGKWRFLTLKEWKEAVRKYNKTAEPEEKIFNIKSYEQFWRRIPGAPSALSRYRKEGFSNHKMWQSVAPASLKGSYTLNNRVFIKGEWRFLNFEEWIEAIVKYNKTAKKSEQINGHSYGSKKLYKRIPGAPARPHRVFKEQFELYKVWDIIRSQCQNAF